MKLALMLGSLAIVLATASLQESSASVEDSAALYGTYTVRLGKHDPDVHPGVWRLTLRKGYHSLLSTTFPIPNQGKLAVSGNVVTFSRSSLCVSAVGRYRFRVSDGKLRLSVIGRDPCSGNDRTVVFTTKLWAKRG